VIRAWRLVKSRHAATAFDGEGARLNGARWNSPGILVAYASESVALATLEVLVHLQSTALLTSYSLASVQFPLEVVEELDVSALPRQWHRFPAPPETQALGDRWVEASRSVVLRVPSAIIPSAYNFLLNLAHPESAKVAIEPPTPFRLDPRLLKRTR
jgi:RES domain-containing protein